MFFGALSDVLVTNVGKQKVGSCRNVEPFSVFAQQQKDTSN